MKLDYDVTPTPLPDWITNDPSMALPKYPTTPEDRLLQETIFANLFETLLDIVVEGQNAKLFITNDPRNISFGRFMSWVMRDPERKRRYEEAQEIGTEVLIEDMKAIADGTTDGPPSDVQRDTLRVNVRKWQAQVHNRKRYGDVKQLEVTNTVNIRQILEDRENKLKLINGVTLDNES